MDHICLFDQIKVYTSRQGSKVLTHHHLVLFPPFSSYLPFLSPAHCPANLWANFWLFNAYWLCLNTVSLSLLELQVFKSCTCNNKMHFPLISVGGLHLLRRGISFSQAASCSTTFTCYSLTKRARFTLHAEWAKKIIINFVLKWFKSPVKINVWYCSK